MCIANDELLIKWFVVVPRDDRFKPHYVRHCAVIQEGCRWIFPFKTSGAFTTFRQVPLCTLVCILTSSTHLALELLNLFSVDFIYLFPEAL